MAKNSKVTKKKLKLSLKQQRLVDKYEGRGTLKQAAEYAGLSYDYARKVVTKRHVQAAIKARQKKLQKKVEVDQKWVLERYKRLTEYTIADFFDDDFQLKPISEIPRDALYAICGLDVSRKSTELGEDITVETLIKKFKLPDKRATLAEIAKLLGLNVEKDGGLSLGDKVKEVKITFVGNDDADRS